MDESLESRLQNFLQAPGYRPMDASGLARGMELTSGERPALRALLREWQAEGRLLRLRQARFILRDMLDRPLTGRVRQTAPSRLLFIPNTEGQEILRTLSDREGGLVEIPVAPHRAMGARDGDTVRAHLRRKTPPSYRRRHRSHRPEPDELRWEAKVVEIVERRPGLWTGLYQPEEKAAFLKGDGFSTPKKVRLRGDIPSGLLAGMSIAVAPLRYPLGNMQAEGSIVEVLGWPGEAGADITRILRQYGLRDTFPSEALAEAEALPPAPSPEECAQREDWTKRCVITIDPVTARDYDDAISVRKEEDGWQLAVHIADVSHYVHPCSALDHEAYLRGNSTYLPDRVLPMLPPRLCDGLCSLREGEPRLTLLCLLKLSENGAIVRASFARAVICSRRRLDYASVQSLFDSGVSTGSAEVDDMLLQARRLAELLRRERMLLGALELDMPELRVAVDEEGNPPDVFVEESDEAHQMIEEFMLAANEQVAKRLRSRLAPAIYRVHEAPDPSRLQEWASTLRSYGIAVGSLASREEICQALQEVNRRLDKDLLRRALLRSLMRARYSSRPLGHYGLAKGDYCHFTSPIRRYADLVVHRALSRWCREGAEAPLPPPSHLEAIASHLSDTERISAAAEHEAARGLLIRYMQRQCELPSPRRWKALITAAYPQGLSVEVAQLQLTGFLSGSDLGDSSWYYERHANRWTSSDGHDLLPGQQVEVVPIRIDGHTGFIDFRRV